MRRVEISIILMSLLVGMLIFASGVKLVKAAGTVYIRADGSIDPPTAPMQRDGEVYTLTGNITSGANGIVVERDNIVVDGSGFTIECTRGLPWHGINLEGRSNATVKNTNIKGFGHGIWLNSSSNNSVGGNTITNNAYSISLVFSSSNSINGNIITNNNYGIVLGDSSDNGINGNNITNSGHGIWLVISSSNSINGNNITNSGHGIWLDSSSNNSISGNTLTDDGLFVWYSYSNVVENSMVNGKPLVYLEGIADFSVGDAGEVVLVRCERIRVEHLNLSRTSIGVELWETNNSIVSGNTITDNSNYGIFLRSSLNNSIGSNTITNNSYNTQCGGIFLDYSSNKNSISGNTITNNSYYGIGLDSASNNNIDGNTITDNSDGISLDVSSNYNSISANNITNNSLDGIRLLYFSSYNSINGNNITNNSYGMRLSDYSSNNSINENTINNNGYGVGLGYSRRLAPSPNNTFCHNSFINNTVQVEDWAPEYPNFWDNDCEGNYWSNYNGTDLDNDGVGDTSLPWEGVDDCPLMNLYWSPCDISHDLKVDMRDIGQSAKAFGTGLGDVLWNPHADITGPEPLVPDGKVDMRDISLVARHFGEHCP